MQLKEARNPQIPIQVRSNLDLSIKLYHAWNMPCKEFAPNGCITCFLVNFSVF